MDRGKFILNPTNCDPMTISQHDHRRRRGPRQPGRPDAGRRRTPFQAANCPSLKFEPKFTVSTSRQNEQGGRREPHREAGRSPARSGPRRTSPGQSRTPQAAPLPADDAAESVHRRAVRSQPRGVPGGVDHRARQGDHADPARPPGRPRVLRLPRRRRLAEPDRRPPGLRRHDRPGRHDVHQQTGHHQQHVQDGPRPARHELRTDPPRGPLQRARRPRQPLQGQELIDADRIHRPERRGDQQTTKIAVTGCPKSRHNVRKKASHKRGKGKRKSKKAAPGR